MSPDVVGTPFNPNTPEAEAILEQPGITQKHPVLENQEKDN